MAEEYQPIDTLTSDEHDWFAVKMTQNGEESLLTATPDEAEAVALAARMDREFEEANFAVLPIKGIYMDNTRYDKMQDLNWYGVIPAKRKDEYITQIFDNFKDLNTFLTDNPAEKFRFVSLLVA